MNLHPQLSSSFLPHGNARAYAELGRESKCSLPVYNGDHPDPFTLAPFEKEYKRDPNTASLYRSCELKLHVASGLYTGNHPHSNDWLRTTYKLQRICNGLITAFVPNKRAKIDSIPLAFHMAVKTHLHFFSVKIAPFITSIHPICIGIDPEPTPALGQFLTDFDNPFETEKTQSNAECCKPPYRYEHYGLDHDQYPDLIGSSYLALLDGLSSQNTRSRAAAGLLRDHQVRLVGTILEAGRKELLGIMPPFSQNRFFELPTDMQQFVQIQSAVLTSIQTTERSINLFLSPQFRSERLELLILNHLTEESINLEVARVVTTLNIRAVNDVRLKIERDVRHQRWVEQVEERRNLVERIQLRWKYVTLDMEERRASRDRLARQEMARRFRRRMHLIWCSIGFLGVLILLVLLSRSRVSYI